MTKDAFNLIIKKIETEFPVKNITYKNVKIWPLLRYILLESLINKKDNSCLAISETHHFTYLLKLSLVKIMKINYNKYNTPLDILYFGKSDERKTEINGKYFNNFGNSLGYFCNSSTPRINFGIIELKNKEYIYGESTFINEDFSSLKTQLHRKALKTKITYNIFRKKIKNWVEFKKYLNSLDLGLNYSEQYIIERFENILNIQKIFEKRLIQINPKAIIFCYFFYDYGFALSLAGKKLGIKTVEIQHGQQGDNNLVYTNWNNLPKEGYEMIPNIFWMWSKQNKTRIDKWLNKNQTHSSIIGGNPWLSYNLNSLKFEKTQLIHKNKTVLICMQNIVLPDFIYTTMKLAPEIYWIIRFHPSFTQLKTVTEKKLKSLRVTNCNLELANSLNLYNLYPSIDIQITFWSTVAYEALVFNIPTILIHKNGKDAMKDYIEKKIFRYTVDPVEILELIKNPTSYFENEKQKFIEYDKKIIKKQLSLLAE